MNLKNTRYRLIFLFLFLLSSLTGTASFCADEVLLIRLEDDVINPITAAYIIDTIEKAEDESAQCVVIQLDTPGGLLNATRAIVKKILNAKVPVIVYVSPSGSRAASAGVFITMSAHVAAMAPSTNIGAAHPVNISGDAPQQKNKMKQLLEKIIDKKSREKSDDDPEEKTVPQQDSVLADKITNDTVAWIKSIANARGRNEQWGEQAVRESISITEHEALQNNVIDMVAVNVTELLNAVDGRELQLSDDSSVILNTRDALVKEISMNFRQRLLNVLANPNLAYILMILGFYGLLYEFTHPGIGFPGIAGLIALILAFYSMQTLPTNYAGVALIGLAVLLFIAEVWVPSFGLLTLGGIAAMVLGSLILFDTPADYMRVSLNIIIPLVLTTAAITFFLVRLVVASQFKKSITGVEGLIGSIGEAYGVIKGKGKVHIQGEIWDAVTDEYIEDKEKIKVIDVKGLILKITKEKGE
ncbi:MAG: nodulation protein NfeD [bacterium]